MKNVITVFSTHKPPEFSIYQKQQIEKNGNMLIIKGLGLTLTGWVNHECDCDRCNIEVDNVYTHFTSRSKLEEYLNNHDVNEVEIEEDSCHYTMAIEQQPCNIGLFKDTE